MNQVYRVVFNRSLGVWQCVSELAKTSGKSSGKTAKPLVVAMAVASAMGNQGALATDYTDGQLHNMGSAYGVVTTDNVSNANTVLQAGQLEFNPNLPTTLNVNNQGKVNITGITFVDSNAQVNIDNATLSSKELLVGYDKVGKVKASNGSTINGEWVSIGNQANGSGDITLQNNSVLNIIDNPSNTNAGILEVGNENTGTLNVNRIEKIGDRLSSISQLSPIIK